MASPSNFSLRLDHLSVSAEASCQRRGVGTVNQAVLGGQLVRLYKLISALLDQICQHRREITFIIARLAFECIVNIRFLIKFGDAATYDS